MATILSEIRWKIHNFITEGLTRWGLKHGYITFYNETLIKKLRDIYYGAVPASILLLSDHMSNGYCYDRALLMSRAFLDEDGDVRLLYASVASLRLNPQYINRHDKDKAYSDHCMVERIRPDGRRLIYDTSSGFAYDKKLYWLIERPKVRKINEKASIIEFVESEKHYYPDDEQDEAAVLFVLQGIERTCGGPFEIYSQPGIGLLQREIKYFKGEIDYNRVYREVDEDMRAKGFRGLSSRSVVSQ